MTVPDDGDWDIQTLSTSEIEQIPVKPRPEGSDLPPISPVKLIALLNQLKVNYQAEMAHEGLTGAFVAIADLKYCIKNKFYDLGAI